MLSIAIDGPAGAGKSTIAKEVAKRLGYIYVDTGALYRAIGLYFLKNNISLSDFSSINQTLSKIDINMQFKNQEQRVFLCGEDVSEQIRTNEVSMLASKVSSFPEIREFLLNLQRDLAKKDNVIMDGRDIGTVVLPNADVKIFLTAKPEKRATRRYAELIDKGIQCDYNQVLTEIITRDHNDSTRTIAPLKPAKDSILVDTTDLDLQAAILNIENIILQNINKN